MHRETFLKAEKEVFGSCLLSISMCGRFAVGAGKFGNGNISQVEHDSFNYSKLNHCNRGYTLTLLSL